MALFPDTVSERAQRHVRELTALAVAGGHAALVFVVQRDDCSAFAPCHEVRIGHAARPCLPFAVVWRTLQAVGLSGHAAVRPLRLEPIRGAVLPAGLLAPANQVRLPSALAQARRFQPCCAPPPSRICFARLLPMPAMQKDPVYGQLVREAAAAGVALLPVVCCLDEAARAVRYRGTLPVDLDYKWKAN